MITKQLPSIGIGETVTVSGLQKGSPELTRKLACMGVVPGSTLTVKEKGPFGSPINISVVGTVLSLRKQEAALIQVAVG